MGDIVQHKARNGHGAQLIKTALRADLVFGQLEKAVGRQEGQGDKAGESAAFALLFAQTAKMVDAVLIGLKVPKKHGAVGIELRVIGEIQ